MIDTTDRSILALLQADATLSVAQIAKQVGLTTTPCWRRIHRLEADGYFKRKVTILNEEKINLSVNVFIAIRTNSHSKQWANKFCDSVKEIPEVIEFFRLSGEIDYLIRAVVPDIKSYDKVYQKLIDKIELYDVSSMFAMETIKSTTEFPLDYA
jgi:Lrp/AsnC family transcriptional regulator